MNTITKKRHPKRSDEEWIQIIQECRTSGLTDKKWCEEHHIAPSNLYYYIRRLTEKACGVAIRLNIHDISMEIFNHAEKDTILNTLDALRTIC